MGQAFQLIPGRFGIKPGRKVVKAEDYQVFLEAQGLIQAAEAEAARIRDDARVAYAREKARGYEDGQKEATKEMASAIFETMYSVDEYCVAVEAAMVQLVADAVRKVIGEFSEEELVVRVVRNALGLVRNQARVSLLVAPSQADTVRAQLDRLLAGLPGISFVDVVPDGRLKPASCVVRSEMGIIEASVEDQLAALEASLKAHQGRGRRHDAAHGRTDGKEAAGDRP
jgi:type III secretion protein L